MIDLAPPHLATVRRILTEHVPECEVLAFGSRVKWTAKDYSDLDLAVRCKKKLNIKQLAKLREAFEESDLPIRVDVVDWHAISAEFREVIEGGSEVVARGGSPVQSGANQWQSVPLSSLCEQVADCPHSTPVWTDTGALVLRSQNIKNGRLDLSQRSYTDEAHFEQRSRRARVRSGDLVMTREAPMGEVCLVPDGLRCCLGQRMVLLRPNPTVCDSRFLLYALQSPGVQAEINVNQGTGSTVSNLRIPLLKALPIPRPPLGQQRAIAHILGTLDDKIELNRRMNQTLEEMARALFKSWFLDFDPVRAKAAGKKPHGMDDATAALFPDSFEQSELGEIPKGWTRAPLGTWVSTLSGGTPSKKDGSLWGGSIPWISPKVMTAIHADEADDFVTPDAIGNGTRIAPAGSTLVMVRGMGLHQEVRVSQARADVTFNQDVKALVPKAIEASLLLFAMLDAQTELLGRVESSGHGTGKLPSEILLGHPITLPPSAVQRQLVQGFDSLNDRISLSRSETRTLGTTRDTLLPRLLSGELPATRELPGARSVA